MRNLAIIPARSGSKGLKDKNIRMLSGKPLLAYSIEASAASGLFDTVMVSTDSEQYANIARKYGAEVPFLRSEQTSSDTASSWDAVEEVLRRYQSIGKYFDTFMLLQPTSPLRTAKNIQEAYEVMKEKNAYSVVSVCEVDHSPLQCNTLPESHSLDNFIRTEAREKRRQDIGTYYRFNGAVYLSKVDFFLECHSIYLERCYAYVMDKRNSIDIDDEFDFNLAECILNMRFASEQP